MNLTIQPMFAALSGEGMVQQLLFVLVVGICVLAIWWVGRWFITKLGGPPMAMTVWNGLFILLGLIVVVNFLLGLVGHPFIHW